MRIRTIKPEFFTHEGLYELEKASGLPIRVAFAGLWCVADKMGRFKWEPRRIGLAILPYDQCDFSRVLEALVARGFVAKYSVGGADFGVIPSFTRHQVINNRERDSSLPEPPEFDASGTRESTREPRVEARDEHAGKVAGTDAGTGEWKGMEGNGKGTGKEGMGTGDVHASTQWFPESLRNEGFIRKWNEWEDHLRESGKPMSSSTRRAQLSDCERAGMLRSIEVINLAFTKGWKSLVWDHQPQKPNAHTSTTAPANNNCNRDAAADYR